jgi:hypothetical protein
MAVSRFTASGITGRKYSNFVAGYDPLAGLSTRAIFHLGENNSGYTPTNLAIDITTTGGGTNFGNSSVSHAYSGGTGSSTTRGLLGGGYNSSLSTSSIEYTTLAASGTWTSFGTLTIARTAAACSNSTRSVFSSGYDNTISNSRVDYITIASTGNATTFGTSYANPVYPSGYGSSTRGLYAGGNTDSAGYNFYGIEYLTFSTTGNTVFFGNRVHNGNGVAAASNNIRGISAGGRVSGGNATNGIDYITIATTGNATDFGTLIGQTAYFSAVASNTRVVFGPGADFSGGQRAMSYVTIATTGNATNFGSPSIGNWNGPAICGSHGGLY